MTHKEALKLKKKIGDVVIKKDMEMSVIVTPELNNDFKNFITDYRGLQFDDYSSLRYSTNSRFKVHGLWTNGADVVYKDLTKQNLNQ